MIKRGLTSLPPVFPPTWAGMQLLLVAGTTRAAGSDGDCLCTVTETHTTKDSHNSTRWTRKLEPNRELGTSINKIMNAQRKGLIEPYPLLPQPLAVPGHPRTSWTWDSGTLHP